MEEDDRRTIHLQTFGAIGRGQVPEPITSSDAQFEFQCVPNFSEGRRPETVAAFVTAAQETPGVRVIDHSMDYDHNRSVVTLLGNADGILRAVLVMSKLAVANIDLRTHTGVHPRIGAIDVVPVVPLRSSTIADADALAHEIGKSLAHHLCIPVYYYEFSAPPGRSKVLPDLRRLLEGATAGAATHLTGDLKPDEGPDSPHITAGVSVVGARGPLVAYNIDLQTSDVRIAWKIARTIRSRRTTVPFLRGVRALGLYLPSRNTAQVSMNLTLPDHTPLVEIWDFVRLEARMLGTDAAESEIIGVARAISLAGSSPAEIHWDTYSDGKILDSWLNE